MSRKSQYVHRKLCAFCENVADSEEHILGQWLDKILPPRRATDKHSRVRSTGIVQRGSWNGEITEAFDKNGRLRTIHKKIVCKNCNNNWMSDIQNDAIPLLTKMILDQPHVISSEDRAKLTNWATMVTMTFEFDHPETQAIPKHQREHFRTNLTPPTDAIWFVWAGMHVGPLWEYRLKHTGHLLSSKDEHYDPTAQKTSQTTMVAIKHIDLFVMSGLGDEFNAIFRDPPAFAEAFSKDFGLLQLWPPIDGDFNWRDLRMKGERDMDEISDDFSIGLRDAQNTEP